MQGIHCEVVEDDPDYLLVRITVNNGEFSGSIEAYMSPESPAEIASQMNGFPLAPSDTREIVFGSFGARTAGGGAKLKFFCSDRSGHAWVETIFEAGNAIVGVVQTALIITPIEATGVDSFVHQLSKLAPTVNRTAWLPSVKRSHSNSLKYRR